MRIHGVSVIYLPLGQPLYVSDVLCTLYVGMVIMGREKVITGACTKPTPVDMHQGDNQA